jgi:DnaJ-class molecular chaperone
LLLEELRKSGSDYGKNDEDGSYFQLDNNDLAIGLCYKILGLNPAATKKEVIAAYRQRAKKHHPDVRGDQVNHDFVVVTKAKNKILEKIG